MELLIRSQNKEALIPYNGLYVCSYYDKYMISNYMIECPNDEPTVPIDCISLGYYNSKDRALEVLDEIQDYLENQGKTLILSDGTFKNYTRVYQMPEE